MRNPVPLSLVRYTSETARQPAGLSYPDASSPWAHDGGWFGRGTKPHPWLPPGGGSREAGGGACVKKRILRILFLNFQKYSYFPRLNRSCRKAPSVCLRQPPPSRREAQSNCAARAMAAKAPGSRRFPALTEFAHSSHLRSTSVSSEMTAPFAHIPRRERDKRLAPYP